MAYDDPEPPDVRLANLEGLDSYRLRHSLEIKSPPRGGHGVRILWLLLRGFSLYDLIQALQLAPLGPRFPWPNS
jgi:hypothetical protein